MVYYLRQNVAILDQISHQISSIEPQVSAPSTPLPPFPPFEPLTSDIRVNAFWFMALIFSLSAALLAILVQQWVRDYMHVFQRYNDPLKSARLRQYLHEGSEGWYMPAVARAVPGLLHVSLFLFFAGLGDFVMNINVTVGISTTAPIFVCSLSYIFTTFVPVIYPQSPFQNSFSCLVWYLTQKLGGRRYKDRGFHGAPKSVSSNMAQGQMQLAMEETMDRMGRDERAIRWLVDNMTEDTEMDSLVMAIPGSFNTQWGREVWNEVSNTIGDKKSKTQDASVGPFRDSDRKHAHIVVPHVVRPSRRRGVRCIFVDKIIRPVRTRFIRDSRADTMALLPVPYLAPHSTITASNRQDTMRGLGTRISHMLETCKNRDFLSSGEHFRRRIFACIETTAFLVCCTNVEFHWIGDTMKLLREIGFAQQNYRPFMKGQLVTTSWVCLSMVASWRMIQEAPSLMDRATLALKTLEGTGDHDTCDGRFNLLTRVPNVIGTFDIAWRLLIELSVALDSEESLTVGQVKEILRNHESQFSELEHIDIKDDSFQNVDEAISDVENTISGLTIGIMSFLPGIEPDSLYDAKPIHFNQLVQLFCRAGSSQFIFPIRNLKRIFSLVAIFRNILKGREGVDTFQETLKNLREFAFEHKECDNPWRNPLHRQVLRLQDLRDGGGFGFTVELFFIVFEGLFLSSSDPPEEGEELRSSLCVGAFRIITSDWSKHKHSLGTQQLLLDMVISIPGIIIRSNCYPTSLVNEFFVLLGNILEGQKGPHIDNVVQELSCNPLFKKDYNLDLVVKALEVIAPARAPCSS